MSSDSSHLPMRDVSSRPSDNESATIEGQHDDDLRCHRCLMPRTAVGLRFDAHNVCSLCSAHEQMRANGSDVEVSPHGIEEKIEEVRDAGRGRPFDCVVGLSGGRDSAYLLYRLVRVHKLRCLAAHYLTPFAHEVIAENVQRTVSRLGVPLESMRISQKQHARVARRVLLMWQAKPSLELINLLCAVCKFVNRELFRIAHRHGIKAVINGGTQYEAFPVGVAYTPPRRGRHVHGLLSQVGRTFRLMRRGLAFLLKNPGVVPLLPIGIKATLLYLSPHLPYLRLRYPDILRLDYFYHVPYDEEECTRVVTSELDWRLPPDCTSYWRADCAMDDLKNVLLKDTVGATYRDAYFSNMVRCGAISRDEGLHRLKHEGPARPERVAAVGRVLDIKLGPPIVP